MDAVYIRKNKVECEIGDLKRRISSIRLSKPVDIVVMRALALKVTELQRELDVINIMTTS